MNVVIDTNVVLSAAISSSGPPAEIIKAWRSNSFDWIISSQTFSELERAFSYPSVTRYLAWNGEQVRDFLNRLHQMAVVVVPSFEVVILADSADNRFLEAAKAGEAEYLVSGDRDLLDLGHFDGIEIVSPTRFLSILRTREA